MAKSIEPDRTPKYTKWSVLGGGEAGCRIAVHYISKRHNPAVESRVVLLNTAQADLSNLIGEVQREIGADDDPRVALTKRNQVLVANADGAGNWWYNGEQSLLKDWTQATTAIRGFFLGTDVIVHVCGLGGGTGNGSAPLLIHRMRQEKIPAAGTHQFAVGVWPEPNEAPHRQLNAIMGLSRMLRYGEEAHGNADFCLLLGNEQLGRFAAAEEIGPGAGNTERNEVVVRVLDALMSAGQRASAIIDARDYAINRQRYHFQHFTAGVAWRVPTHLLIEEALSVAGAKLLIGIEPAESLIRSAISGYLIVQVPPHLLHDPDFAVSKANEAFLRWQEKTGARLEQAMATVVPDASLDDSYHAVLFLGGFDLNALVQPHKDRVDRHARILARTAEGKPQAEALELGWKRLVQYVEDNDATRKELRP